MNKLGETSDTLTIIYEDNQGCIAIASSGRESHKFKHRDIRIHFPRDMIKRGDIDVVYVGTLKRKIGRHNDKGAAICNAGGFTIEAWVDLIVLFLILI